MSEDDLHWCADDFFGRNIKPFITFLVGDDGGYSLEEAKDPDREPEVHDLRDLLDDDEEDRYLRPATTAHERMLRTSEAYDTAVTHLISKLPDCRDCGCIRLL